MIHYSFAICFVLYQRQDQHIHFGKPSMWQQLGEIVTTEMSVILIDSSPMEVIKFWSNNLK